MSERRGWLARGADATAALGESIGRHAPAGLVLGLTGPLGAGKTTFIQGLARGLEVPEDVPVTSPTFALVHHYMGRLPLVHIDAYRLRGPEELRGIDAEDWLSGGGVVAVEWADRVAPGLPPETLWCHIQHRTPEDRAITLLWEAPPAGCTLERVVGTGRIHSGLIVVD